MEQLIHGKRNKRLKACFKWAELDCRRESTNHRRAGRSEQTCERRESEKCWRRVQTEQANKKSKIAALNANDSDSKTDSDSLSSTDPESETGTIELADTPSLKTTFCYSINQVEILQTLGNYTFATHFEADNFLQKKFDLKKTPDTIKFSRLQLPTCGDHDCTEKGWV